MRLIVNIFKITLPLIGLASLALAQNTDLAKKAQALRQSTAKAQPLSTLPKINHTAPSANNLDSDNLERVPITIDPQSGKRWIDVSAALAAENQSIRRHRQKLSPSFAQRENHTAPTLGVAPIRFAHLTPAFPAFNPQAVEKILADLPNTRPHEIFPMGAPISIASTPLWGLQISPSGKYFAAITDLQVTQVRDIDKGEIINPAHSKIGEDSSWMAFYDRFYLPMQTTRVKNASKLAKTATPHNELIFGENNPTESTTLTKISNKESSTSPRLITHYQPTPIDLAGRQTPLPWVYALSFYPNGELLVTGGSDGQIRVWKIRDGTLQGEPISAHQGWIYALAVDPTGKLLASAGNDGTIRIFSAETGAVLLPPITIGGEIYALRFTPKGDRLFAACSDGNIRVFETGNGRLIGGLAGHQKAVFALALTADGETLASAGEDGTIRLWSAPLGVKIAETPAQSGTIYGLAFNPGGNLLASAGADSQVKMWSTPSITPTPFVFYTQGSPLLSLAFSADGTQLVAGSADQKIWLWNTATAQASADSPILAHQGWINHIAFAPSGNFFASASADGTVKLWKTEPSPIDSASNPASAPIQAPTLISTAPMPTRPLIAHNPKNFAWLIANDRLIRQIANNAKTEIAPPITTQAKITAVNFSVDGGLIIAGLANGEINIWSAHTGTLISRGFAHEKISALALSEDERWLALGDESGKVTVMMRTLSDSPNAASLPQPIRKKKVAATDEWVLSPINFRDQHQGAVNALVFNGGQLISAGNDQKLRWWSLKDGAHQSFGGHFSAITSLAIDLTHPQLISGGYDGSAQKWQWQ